MGSEERGRAGEEDGDRGETPLTCRAWPGAPQGEGPCKGRGVGGSGGAGERHVWSGEMVVMRDLVAGGSRNTP